MLVIYGYFKRGNAKDLKNSGKFLEVIMLSYNQLLIELSVLETLKTTKNC